MGAATEEPAAEQARRRSYYLLDDVQSADLEEFRFTLLALADLGWNGADGENGEIKMNRENAGALFATLEKRLATIIRDGHLDVAWLDDGQVNHKTWQ